MGLGIYDKEDIQYNGLVICFEGSGVLSSIVVCKSDWVSTRETV